MNVLMYTQLDGDPWGVWCRKHLHPERVINKINQCLADNGYLPVTADQIEHAYGIYDPLTTAEEGCHFHLAEEEEEGSIPITLVKGEYLQSIYPNSASDVKPPATQFVRETKYYVIKLKEMHAALTSDEQSQLEQLLDKVAQYRSEQGKAPLQCVVVESDSSLYEPTYQALENQVAGSAASTS